MNNWKLVTIIAEREFRQSIRQKGFWLFTLLFPILLLTLSVVPLYFSGGASEQIQVHIISNGNLFKNLPIEGSFSWSQEQGTLEDALKALATDNANVVAYYEKSHWQVMSNQTLSPAMRGLLERYLQTLSTTHHHALKPITYQLPEHQERSMHHWAMIPGVLFIMVMTYYGNRLVKGFLEEKQNRIAEVILSHLQPSLWLAGKALGVAYLALTQLVIWTSLGGSIGYLLFQRYGEALSLFSGENAYQLMLLTDRPDLVLEWSRVADWLTQTPDYAKLAMGALAYPIFFISYSALLGVIASRGQQESDSQPWVFAVNLPLLLFTGIAPILYASPNGISEWFWAVFPLSAPICLPYYIMAHSLVESILISTVSIGLQLLMVPFLAKKFREGILRF
jgi:ABC-2 type transport system permease protein